MKTRLGAATALLALAIALASLPAMATTAISHDTIPICSAYDGDTLGNRALWSGYTATPPTATAAYPGTLVIDPGGSSWSNFVGAAQASVPYSIRGVTLTKQSPSLVSCSDVYPGSTITQQGTPYIRLNWPLQYEAPGTTWTLTILYGTPTYWDDDGPGPNPASVVHADIWTWDLQSDPEHLASLVNLFHDVGAGASGVPPISDEPLYAYLSAKCQQANAAWYACDLATTAYILADAEMQIMDSCMPVIPAEPSPTAADTGIILTPEYPACCKLLADIQSLFTQIVEVFPSPQPAMAKAVRASQVGQMLGRTTSVRSAYVGDSGSNATVYRGYLGSTTGPVAFPGVLGIVPGDDWSNFVAAARENVPYTLGDVTLTKTTPAEGNCTGATEATTIVQSGAGIRLWWPLMYDAPGTVFTLSLNYTTETPRRFAGESAASTQHHETWRCTVREDMQSLAALSKLFNEVAFGTSGVPLFSDEGLYGDLLDSLTQANTSLADGDVSAVQATIDDFGVAVLDACKSAAPAYPSVSGPDIGIMNTETSPAGCRLLAGSASTKAIAAADISEIARNAEDGAAVALTEPKIATLVQPGYFYAQDQSRVCGLKVIGSIDGLQSGAMVKLRGILSSNGPERVLALAGYEVESAAGALPRSLAMRNRLVGGQGSGVLPGFAGATGLFNGGLRVTVAGSVGSAGSDYVYIDDGSRSLRVILPPGTTRPSADYVRVTGVSAWFDSSGLAEPAVIADDISPVE